MATRQVRLRPAAYEDLRRLWNYIAGDKSPRQADAVIRQLNDRFPRIAEYPDLGKDYGYLRPGLRGDVRRPFIIFYYSRPDYVDIVRVLHGARRLDDLF